jgi:hypothetical protein
LTPVEVLTFDVPPSDVPVVERLANGAVDLSLRPVNGRLVDGRLVAAPPALTPILHGFGDAYLGLWRHPAAAGRTVSYVEYVWETSRAREIARTAEQLVAWIFVHVLEAVDDRHTDPRWSELETAAAALGLDDLGRFFDETALGLDAIHGLPQFRADPPRDASSAPPPGYDGEFPRLDEPATAARAAGCEVPVDPPPHWLAAARAVAPWLGPGSPVPVFSERLAAGAADSAWFALNSPGWSTEAVQRALERLDTVVDDDRLRLLAEDWTRRTDRRTGGY